VMTTAVLLREEHFPNTFSRRPPDPAADLRTYGEVGHRESICLVYSLTPRPAYHGSRHFDSQP
jgi:hypothetical protein